MKSRVLGILIPLLAAAAWAATGSAGEQAQHPELGPEEMYIACADCHLEATPELHAQWYDSVHGIAMVKCYQCHGTFETFRVTPTRSDCAVCHEDMLNKCPQDKDCWQCHVPHRFKADKEQP